MQILGIEKLAKDYEIVLKEYFGKFNTIQELYSKVQNENIDWRQRWDWVEDYNIEKQPIVTIENYFFKESFIKIYQEKITEYVKANPTKLYRTE